MNLDLNGKTAIVTGPAKGMGAAITLALAREGVDLCLAGRDMAAIAPVAAEVKKLGRKAVEAKCDLTSEKDVQGMVARALDAFGGRIDILVNVAGGRGPLETTAWDTTPEQMDEILALNVKGAFLAMKAVTPAMQKQRYGKIVNIGGTFGLRGRGLRMAYSASKWGVRGVVKAFALELGPYNINVNNVAPGMVDGPRFRKVCEEMSKRLGISMEQAMRKHAEEYALKRVSTDEDVANAVLFFASDASRQITGQDIAVDGGWVI
ncbi:MAG TPA: SDR family NAD(P)-dependent oxidoreductase [Burkholderiales bacterium]|nr:SDR family NAD(P)-dependent oxidoreductase [Burkholderiales bacterium]